LRHKKESGDDHEGTECAADCGRAGCRTGGDAGKRTDLSRPPGQDRGALRCRWRRGGHAQIGTVNIGGTQNLGAELLKSAAGIDVQIVSFRNSPEIVVGLLRNDVQMMVDFPAAVKGQFDDGKLRNGMTSLGNRPRVLIVARKI
jgi:hypothetical protein